ncbi:MAG: cation-transporting ATPase A, Ca2+-transporting ATPase [Candidatus Peregrinibacteria bacterium GW2011_GWE2_39_6]|nr:MAG: cation-transporting ATPase A, Ca2+-transporting ATPase [Candidatus Peregrinibacteria bacterium GW2011_GWF2_39_17]KKR26107.1 MAG: cation-transporting ATPase A, Ca2+-transporting ATPase [Candidatus Peregrinibacteria bacterium GW2011_GWE2_39_6]HCW32692.1 calcium-translocating P-type ATPase, PMCA-type [Candidatus Peregrinibacteria bacterium]
MSLLKKNQLFTFFKTTEQGLTDLEAQKRLNQYGPNAIIAKKKKPLWRSFLEEFTDLMVIILIIAAILAAIAGEKTDASVILFIVILNATIGFIQKFKAEKALEALKKMLSPTAKVIRNGKLKQIEAHLLVPGDLIMLSEGDNISADAQIIDAKELQIDESALTGESIPVTKNSNLITKKGTSEEHCQLIFMGTAVTHGTGTALVLRTGMNTEFGKIAHLTQTTKKDKSPLQKELFKIGIFVSKITFLISSVLLLVGWLWQGKNFVDTLLFATSVAVAAVPEGLPATITIALAIGVQRLVKNQAIIKKLASVETLGSTTVICSDKTGTLTQNRMTVTEIFTDNLSKNLLFESAILCNNAKLNNTKKTFIGDPTEGALLLAAEQNKLNTFAFLKNHHRIDEIPFDSERKMMTTINQNKKTKKLNAYLKGAPDEVLKCCTHCYENGKIVKLTPKKRETILQANEQMARKALRVLAFAQRPLKNHTSLVEQNMIFLGLMGMIDPPRPEVNEAVKIAKQAGIKIYMITGDYGLTAKAIAEKVGIVKGDNVRIIKGEELNQISQKSLAKLFKSNKEELIFARVNPEHKLKIIAALKENGEIIAMTGDGVNDAPALKRADIGVAMGITGTDVSKEAADMILVDDSFGTIVRAIKEGRTIYENLKKFVFYVFSCNIGELITVFVAIILAIPAPLTAILILAVNLGTDVLPAIALGVDPPEPGIMDKPPRSPKDHIMKRNFILHFSYLGLIIGTLVILVYFKFLYAYGWTWGEYLTEGSYIHLKASTSAFALLVLIQMANALNSRSQSQSIFKLGIWSNRTLLAAIMISIISVFLFVEIPFFQKFLHTTSLNLQEWGIIVIMCSGILIVEELRKLVLNRKFI